MVGCGRAQLRCSFPMALLSALIMIICFFTSAGGALIGINYGRVANNLPPPQHVVKLMQKEGFKRAKIFDADNATIRAFAHSGIDLIVGLPNDELASIGKSFERALMWVEKNISHHIPATQISAIAVGNEVLTSSPQLYEYLVPAMKNVYLALKQLKLHEHIKVSSPHALAILSSSFPPSAGTFQPNLTHKVMKPMFEFLNWTNSYAMVNVYPFYAYKANPKDIPLNYAIFGPSKGIHDPKNKLHYSNLFDAMLDSWFFAMKKMGYLHLKVVVTESGWPSKGDHDEPGCTLRNAATYNRNLVKHIVSKKGTPLKPKIPLEAYIFALFNEDLKPGPLSERNYGLLRPNGKKVYDFELNPKHKYHDPHPTAKSHHSPHEEHHNKQRGSPDKNQGMTTKSSANSWLQRAGSYGYLGFHSMSLVMTLLAFA